MVLDLIQKGGPVMWWLMAVSLVSMSVILERFLFFWKESLRHKPLQVQNILSLVEKNRLEEAIKIAERFREGFVIRTLHHGLTHKDQALNRALEAQAFNEMRRMKKNLTLLDTAITAAPLLGILGTVIGIIGSFDALGSGGVGNPLNVTKGISEALITTAFGLIVALGVLVPTNYFKSCFRQNLEELESACSALEFEVQKNHSDRSLAGDRIA